LPCPGAQEPGWQPAWPSLSTVGCTTYTARDLCRWLLLLLLVMLLLLLLLLVVVLLLLAALVLLVLVWCWCGRCHNCCRRGRRSFV
jgi:hypothetical protein